MGVVMVMVMVMVMGRKVRKTRAGKTHPRREERERVSTPRGLSSYRAIKARSHSDSAAAGGEGELDSAAGQGQGQALPPW